MAKAGVFSFRTRNLGDEMQSYAALGHLNQVDAFLDRDHLADFDSGEDTTCIFNSRFIQGDDFRPSAECIKPLWHGFAISKDQLLEGAWLDRPKDGSQIGGRDLYTAERLTTAGVDAHFTGCLSLFLGHAFPALERRRKGVLFVDLPAAAEAFIPDSIVASALRLSTFPPASMIERPLDRWAAVARLAALLAGARLVVTRRLHVALPCVGFGTPVVAIPDPDISQARLRFSGYEAVMPTVFLDDVDPGLRRLDWSAIPAPVVTPDMRRRHAELRAALDSRGLSGGPFSGESILDQVGSSARLRNPLGGRRPSRIRLRLHDRSCELDVHLWTDQFLEVGLRRFPGLSRFAFRVEMGPNKREHWDDVGALQELVVQ